MALKDTVEYGLATRACQGYERSECGDLGFIEEFDGQLFIALLDGLGHGGKARRAALRGQGYLKENCRKELVVVMQGLHEHLKGTRGVVAALCHFSPGSGELRHTGIGNIHGKKYGVQPETLVPRDGVVGYCMPTPREQRLTLVPGDILVLCTDGISSRLDLTACPALLKKDARDLAAGIIQRFGKQSDDAGCVVLRYKGC